MVLRLKDGAGGSVQARGVEVRRLGPDPGTAAELTAWTFEDQVAVFPLPVGEVTLAVGQGELAALQAIDARAGAEGATGATEVQLRRTAVVDLSGAGATGLFTETAARSARLDGGPVGATGGSRSAAT